MEGLLVLGVQDYRVWHRRARVGGEPAVDLLVKCPAGVSLAHHGGLGRQGDRGAGRTEQWVTHERDEPVVRQQAGGADIRFVGEPDHVHSGARCDAAHQEVDAVVERVAAEGLPRQLSHPLAGGVAPEQCRQVVRRWLPGVVQIGVRGEGEPRHPTGRAMRSVPFGVFGSRTVRLDGFNDGANGVAGTGPDQVFDEFTEGQTFARVVRSDQHSQMSRIERERSVCRRRPEFERDFAENEVSPASSEVRTGPRSTRGPLSAGDRT